MIVCGLLLAGDYSQADRFEVRPLKVPAAGRPGFQRLPAADVGLVPTAEFQVAADQAKRSMGNSGLAAGDVDGDGLVDLFVCGMLAPNTLYRNRGDWRFEDVTAKAGVGMQGWRLSGAVFADVDGDGDLDLIATSLLDRRDFLFLNDGAGHFEESFKPGWVNHPRGGSVGASLADVDGDGDLDLYMTRYVNQFAQAHMTDAKLKKIEDAGKAAIVAGRSPPRVFYEYFTVLAEPGEVSRVVDAFVPDQVYLNDGRGGFAPVSDRDRMLRDRRGEAYPMPAYSSHEAAFRDVDADGDPDLYVTGDFDHPDSFLINDGRGVFQKAPNLSLRHTSQFSMGLDFSDLNRDGLVDFVTVDMLSRSHQRRKIQMGNMQPTESAVGVMVNRPQVMQNTLQLNRGDGTWTEIGQLAGVKASEWSWGAIFTDVDLDGYEDLIVATGMTQDLMHADARSRFDDLRAQNVPIGTLIAEELFPELPTPNGAYRNRGDLTFEYVSRDWGFDVDAVSGGIARADFDNDGDPDLVINNDNAPLEVYRNRTHAPRVAVRLIGLAPNTGAIGAKVRLLGGPGGSAPMEHEIQCGGGYASGSDPLVMFGTGTITNGLKLEVIWRLRDRYRRTVIDEVRPNQHYTVWQSPDDETYSFPKAPQPEPIFESADRKLFGSGGDGSMATRSLHADAPFDDFAYQPLLPNRLSQLGPGVSWIDLNADGWDDLVVGSGRGGRLKIQMSDGRGGFQHRAGAEALLDQTTVLGWPTEAGAMRLLVGQANYEEPDRKFERPDSAIVVDPLKTDSDAGTMPGHLAATGPLALADVDGDGDLDVFVGGRVTPAQYPAPTDSRLFLNDAGTLKIDGKNQDLLSGLGMISGATFGDLDDDGDADLVLAPEWGPITVLLNQDGRFEDATEKLGFAKKTGWWNSVALGDLDGDGRLDIVGGNWGRNSKYESSYSEAEPLRMAYADFDTNGVLDIVEYHFDKETRKMVPERGRSCSTRAMPFIGMRNPTFEAFGSGSLDEVYGRCLKLGAVLEAWSLEHTLFLNRGGAFEARPLPIEAQFAPVFGINIADFDGDGNEDVFTAQNFFASQAETPRSDGGRGLLMLGDGKGGLRSLSGGASGIKVYGEQRGSAVADFDHDGRADLAVTQNGSHTRTFRNRLAKPGLRVRLKGSPANPTAVGARVRLRFTDDTLGPVRPITAGSGYWSQDSAVVVLGTPKPVRQIDVTWPDGSKSSQPVPIGASEVEIGK